MPFRDPNIQSAPPQPSSGPLKFPFPPGSIPGPPQGRTLPDQRDAEKYPWPSQSPPEKPPWLKALDLPGEPGIDPDYQWEFAPPIDKDEQLRRDFQEKMFPPPHKPWKHEIDAKIAQGGNQPPPIS